MDKVASSPSSSARIVSMDQFRGYTVAGMFLVNFVGGLAAFPEVLKHHNGHPYFSYADSIMPSFMFAAGFSYRLTTLRRLAQQGAASTYGHVLVRSLALVLVSLVMYMHGDVDEFKKWAEMTPEGIWKFVGMLLESEPLGSAGDHRRHPDASHSGDRRELPRQNDRPGRLCDHSSCNLLFVQFLLRLRQAELAGYDPGADR